MRISLLPLALLALFKHAREVGASNDLSVQQQQQQQPLAAAGLPATEVHAKSKQDDIDCTNSDFEQEIKNALQAQKPGRRHEHDLLSRKRRYLLFPKGSSIQLTYHFTNPIIGYSNTFVLHLTCAFAYPLPFDAPSDLLEDLRQTLRDGDLDVSRIDNATNVKYVDTKTTQNVTTQVNYIPLGGGGGGSINSYKLQPMFRPPMHGNFYATSDSYYRRQPPARRKDNHYYRNKYRRPMNPFNDFVNYSEKDTKKYPWWQLQSRLSNSLRPMLQQQNSYYRQPPHSTTPSTTTTTTELPPLEYPMQHTIIPILVKRSIPYRHRRQHERAQRNAEPEPDLTIEDRVHYREHRSSRHELYGHIEKYLETHDQHGEHCVLRALCETGQKSHEDKPGTFVGELLRAVFTLPEPLHNDYLGTTHYDRANAHEGDCAAKYYLCKHSMWEAEFVK